MTGYTENNKIKKNRLSDSKGIHQQRKNKLYFQCIHKMAIDICGSHYLMPK